MENKFCFSKTTAYLIALVVAVVGTFFATNYINSQRLNYNSEAAQIACKENGVKGVFSKDGCTNLAKRMGTPFHEFSAGNTVRNSVTTSYCCIPDKVGKPSSIPLNQSLTNLKNNCKTLSGQIAANLDYGKGLKACVKFTGNYFSTTRVNNQVKNPEILSQFPWSAYCNTGTVTYDCKPPVINGNAGTCSQLCSNSGGSWCKVFLSGATPLGCVNSKFSQLYFNMPLDYKNSNNLWSCNDPSFPNGKHPSSTPYQSYTYTCCQSGCVDIKKTLPKCVATRKLYLDPGHCAWVSSKFIECTTCLQDNTVYYQTP